MTASSTGEQPPERPSANSTVGAQPPASTAFLLSQVGAHAASLFAQRVAPLGVGPAHAGILRLLAGSPDLNQRAVASAVGTTPSRIVALLDELEEGGLLERARRADDRRSHVVRLTAAGRKTLADVGAAARAHDAELMSVLTPEEREDLHRLLQRVANANGLSPRIHPGYRTMPERQ